MHVSILSAINNAAGMIDQNICGVFIITANELFSCVHPSVIIT